MKITFVLSNLGDGGAERVSSALINYFSDQRHEVQVVLIYRNEIFYKLNEDIRVDYVNVTNVGGNVLSKIKKLIELRNTIQGEYVISFNFGPIKDTVTACLFSNKKVIISERTDPRRDIGVQSIKNKAIRMIAYSLAKQCVFQTEGARDYYPFFIKKKSCIIPNPVLIKKSEVFEGAREKTVVTTCRLEAQKNIPLMINAFSLLRKEFPDYQLVIYGRGSLESEINQYIKSKKLEDCVVLGGFLKPDEVAKKVQTASLYVISSDYEGISNSLIEALALGVPVVSTDSPPGGARMMIDDGVSGLLVPTNDADALYNAMKRVLSDPELSEELGQNAKKIVDKYPLSKIGDQWIAMLQERTLKRNMC